MKKFILILVLMLSFLFTEEMITKNYCNLREHPTNKIEVLHVIGPFEKVDMIRPFTFYNKVKLIFGTKHVGKIGYLYFTCIDKENLLVSGLGGTLREKPMKKSKDLGSVKSGAKIQILEDMENFVDWYEVIYNDVLGYIYKTSLTNL